MNDFSNYEVSRKLAERMLGAFNGHGHNAAHLVCALRMLRHSVLAASGMSVHEVVVLEQHIDTLATTMMPAAQPGGDA